MCGINLKNGRGIRGSMMSGGERRGGAAQKAAHTYTQKVSEGKKETLRREHQHHHKHTTQIPHTLDKITTQTTT